LKTNRIWAVLSLAGLLASCHFTEEITLNENGTGSISLNFDGSELMSMAGDSAVTEDKAVDSLIYFADLLREKKDSIATLPAAEQERLKRLEPYRMHLKSDPAAKEMLISLSRDFKAISEVEDAFRAFQSSGALESTQQGPDNEAPDFSEGTEVTYSFGSGRFSRTTIVTDSALFRQRLDSLESGSMFLAGSTYTLKIHFPKRVKSASSQEATLSVDGKTLIREVDFLEYLKNPGLLNIEVELED
jgi:hypothetical protein